MTTEQKRMNSWLKLVNNRYSGTAESKFQFSMDARFMKFHQSEIDYGWKKLMSKRK
ncbi:hypothetical protein PS2_139 [Serratia phage PS2]|uniref:Uncharacterized protein n=1 Tax=Serratia phage PS2 TaxID=1481112 RepID=A0A023W546_9CAUD|nr:hypothetical protein FF83_gp139 [Serratia phage PS2]AHY25385.1 hypothetical protein PS2_139 [Serratia phage PS2]